MQNAAIEKHPERKVTALLVIGILLAPGFFVWFLLRQGHSTLARVIGFSWAGFMLLVWVAVVSADPASQTAYEDHVEEADLASSAGSDEVSDVPAQDASTTPEEPSSEWAYSTDKDEMRGGDTRYAQLEGSNTIDLDFPYGEQQGLMIVRQSPQFGFDILVGVRSGQIMCNSFSNSKISVKFDDGPIRTYGCNDASDGSNNLVFVQGAKGFLANLKKSKKVVVEAEFFQNGMQQLTFNTANLKWEN